MDKCEKIFRILLPMKHLLLIFSVVSLFCPLAATGQSDLVVRELTTRVGIGGEEPLREILRSYNPNGLLLEEVTLLGGLDKESWRKESEITFLYDEADRLTYQTKTFYSIRPFRVTIQDELTWQYDQEGNTIHYSLFRENFDADRQEGFSYDYFFQNGCPAGFLAYRWDEGTQEFVFDFENKVTVGMNCLPVLVDNGTYRYRYEYEFDAEQRPIKETTWRGLSDETEEELISVFSITYGEGYEVRVFDGIVNDLHYVDSTVYQADGKPIYQLERSNLRSFGQLEPSEEIVWAYDGRGNEIFQSRSQSWNAAGEYWETTRVDSVITEEWGRREVFEFLSRSESGVIDRIDRRVTIELPRCDDLPEWRITEYFQNGMPIGQAEQTRLIYAGPPPCDPWVAVDQLDLYPNPAMNEVQLRAPILGAGDCLIRIYAQDGQQIAEYQKEFLSNGDCLDVSAFPEGLYYVSVERGSFILSRKLLIQRP